MIAQLQEGRCSFALVRLRSLHLELILMAKEILTVIRKMSITTVNKYTPNMQPLGFIKQILTRNLKGEIDINT